MTDEWRHGYLDAIDGTFGADDSVASRVTGAAHRFTEEFAHEGSSDAVAAARELSAAADAAMQAAVDRARAAGQSWREIGDVLGTSRQAAFQRFGHPVDPRTGVPMSREVSPDAAGRAAAILSWLSEGRLAEILAGFDDNMRARVDGTRLSDGWVQMTSLYGRLERFGDPFARRVGDDTLVDVPLHFEAGDARGVIRFSGDGKIAGLAIRPPLSQESS